MDGIDKTKNKLKDLNDYMFMQLEKLMDEELTQEQLKNEIKKTNALSSVANSIISIGKLQLEAVMFANAKGITNPADVKKELPSMFPNFAKIEG